MDEPIVGTFSLEEFNPKKAELIELGMRYKNLTISGIEDKEGYKAVDRARIVLKSTRNEIEKKGKELRDPHTQFNKKVSEIEKGLIALIEPIEKELKEKVDAIDKEIEIKKEQEKEKEKEKLQNRINLFKEIEYTDYNPFALKDMTDEEFNNIYEVQKQNFLINKEEKIEAEEKIKYINSIDNIEDFEKIERVFIGPYSKYISEAYDRKKVELINKRDREEIEKEKEKLRLANEEIERKRKKEFEEKSRIESIRNRILNTKSLIDLEKLKLEIEDKEFDNDFSNRERELKIKEEEDRLKREKEEADRKQREEEEKAKQAERDRIAKEEEEKKIKKREEYAEWKKSLGVSEENKNSFKEERVGDKVILWKNIGEFNINN